MSYKPIIQNLIKIFYENEILYYKYEERSPKKLIPISENYFLVEGVDYFRIKFITTDGSVTLKQIFSYGPIKNIPQNN